MGDPLYRTFAGDILCEVGIPDRRRRDVIIILPGLPSIPKAQSLCKRLVAEGFIVVAPRYRGTWESNGKFLERSPVEDVHDVVNMVRKGRFAELSAGATVTFSPRRILVWGSSFGGYVGIAAMKANKALAKGVFFAPLVSVVRLGEHPPEEKPREHLAFLARAWPNVYRLRSGTRFIDDSLVGDGCAEMGRLRGKRLLIYHAVDDDVVSVHQSRSFVEEAGRSGVDAELVRLRSGGHAIALSPARFRRILRFLREA